jgi:hypothetical protein
LVCFGFLEADGVAMVDTERPKDLT